MIKIALTALTALALSVGMTNGAIAHKPQLMDAATGRLVDPMTGSLIPFGECLEPADYHHTIKPAKGVKSVNIRTSPKTGKAFNQLAAGTKVAFVGYAFDVDGFVWYKVYGKNGITGWVTAGAF